MRGRAPLLHPVTCDLTQLSPRYARPTSHKQTSHAMRTWMIAALLALNPAAAVAGTPLPDAPHVVVQG